MTKFDSSEPMASLEEWKSRKWNRQFWYTRLCQKTELRNSPKPVFFTMTIWDAVDDGGLNLEVAMKEVKKLGRVPDWTEHLE